MSGACGLARGRRQPGHQRLQHLFDIEPGLGRDQHRVRGVEPDHILDLLADPLGLGRRQVDLVQHRHDLVPGLDRLIDIGEGLRLDPLARIDDQQRALAGGERAADLVGEIDMARRVHQIEDIALAVLRPVFEAHGLRLDRDAALALQLHIVEHLLAHLARLEPAASLDQPIGEGRLAVVDMRDDREIADMRERRHASAEHKGPPAAGSTRAAVGGHKEGDAQCRAPGPQRRADCRSSPVPPPRPAVQKFHRRQMQRVQCPNGNGKRLQRPHQYSFAHLGYAHGEPTDLGPGRRTTSSGREH